MRAVVSLSDKMPTPNSTVLHIWRSIRLQIQISCTAESPAAALTANNLSH